MHNISGQPRYFGACAALSLEVGSEEGPATPGPTPLAFTEGDPEIDPADPSMLQARPNSPDDPQSHEKFK